MISYHEGCLVVYIDLWSHYIGTQNNLKKRKDCSFVHCVRNTRNTRIFPFMIWKWKVTSCHTHDRCTRWYSKVRIHLWARLWSFQKQNIWINCLAVLFPNSFFLVKRGGETRFKRNQVCSCTPSWKEWCEGRM